MKARSKLLAKSNHSESTVLKYLPREFKCYFHTANHHTIAGAASRVIKWL